MSEAWKLGIDCPIFISAMHGDGMQELFEAIQESIPFEKVDEFEMRKKK